jgi:molecular chaperone GrpE (heat shock protein)
MTDKKRFNKTSKLKNFLVTGTIEEDDEKLEMVEVVTSAETPPAAEAAQEELPKAEEKPIEDIIVEEKIAEPVRAPVQAADVSSLEREIADLRKVIAGLTDEIGKYTTTKEQLKEYSTVMNKRDAEMANKKFMVMLEQLCVMREDFFKLCGGMKVKLNSFSPGDILCSFEAYGVDMENILVDCGVQIGPTKFERLNTIHQRIVDVIPTDDESINGMIAERVSDGYVYQGRVLLKEKVKTYRFSENGKTEGDEEK